MTSGKRGRPRRYPLGEALQTAVQEQVEDAIEHISTEETPSPNDAETFQQEQQIERRLHRALSRFPSSKGYYGKVYKQNPGGGFTFLWILEQLEDIEDPEITIRQLMTDNGWSGGIYTLKVHKRGSSKDWETYTTTIAAAPVPAVAASTVVSSGQQPTLDQVADFIEKTRKITNDPSQQYPPEMITKLADTLKDALKIGVETVRGSSSESLKPTDVLIAMTALVEKIQAKSQPERNDIQLFGQMIQLFKELQPSPAVEPAHVETAEDDFWDKLLKLKELGVIKFAGEVKDDTIDQITKISQLVAALQSFTGGGGNTSTAGELIRVIGPHVPEIVKDITGAVRGVTDYASARLGKMPSRQLSPKESQQIEKQVFKQSEKEHQEVPVMLPIFQEI
ncbi:MAG: hypothetical protein AABY15_08450, partial [Nanoarchaeota archaeon]